MYGIVEHDSPTKIDKGRLFAAVTMLVTASVMFTLTNVSGSNLAITTTDYGFPLPFARVYGPGPVIPLRRAIASGTLNQFFGRALLFDAVFAVVAVGAATFSVYRWSASWSARSRCTFCVALATLGLPFFIELPAQFGLPFLLVLVLVGPAFVLWTMLYAIWRWASALLGSRFAPLACALATVAGVGSVLWAYPHDPFLRPATSDVPLLLGRRDSDDLRTRLLAIRALGRCDLNQENVADAIVESISDKDSIVRMEAISLAARLGSHADKAVPALVAALRDKSNDFLAADALAQIGPDAKDAIPILRGELATAGGYKKLAISRALWSIEQNDALAVPELIELLSDDFGPIRRDAASLLGRIGPPAKAAVPTLVKMLHYVPSQEVSEVPATGKDQMARQSPDQAPLPALRQMSEHEFYPQIRSAVADALKKIDPEAATRDRATTK